MGPLAAAQTLGVLAGVGALSSGVGFGGVAWDPTSWIDLVDEL
jgi:hypothetical protein